MSDPWFPDYVARWYDEFRVALPYPDSVIANWTRNSTATIRTYKERLIDQPHSTAVELDEFVKSGTSMLSAPERRYHALLCAAEVFRSVGVRRVRLAGGEEWHLLRRHWQENGNLLSDDVKGYLLPMEPRPHRWAWRYKPQRRTEEDYFKEFVRWRCEDSPNYTIKVSVIPETYVWSGWPNNRLRIGVVPLVGSVEDFDVRFWGEDVGTPCFSMSVKDSAAVRDDALRALEASAKDGCDIVVFPELCLTPEIQESLRERLVTLGDYPWLVIAGSARTPVDKGGVTAHYNQALAFDQSGKQKLAHHKQYQYSMTVGEQKRYGLLEAFGQLERMEDMEVEPFELEILDTDIGRIAVLICEDLSVTHVVERLVIKFGLNWLFVPVLDGCQKPDRWTAHFGRQYAKSGTCVVVATSLSLARQDLSSAGTPGPPGVGTVVIPQKRGSPVTILASDEHDKPVYVDF